MTFSAFNFDGDRLRQARDITKKRKRVRFGRRIFLVLAGLIVLIIIMGMASTGFYVDYLWFQSLGFERAYVTVWQARGTLFLLGFIVFLILFIGNTTVARRLTKKEALPYFIPPQEMLVPDRLIDYVISGIGILLGLIMAVAVSSSWATFLRYSNAVGFGTTDPIFKRDIGFFVFSLPLYRFLQGWLTATLFIVLFAIAVIYLFDFRQQRFHFDFTPAMKAHLSVIGAAILLLFAWSYRLDIFDLVFSHRGVVFGASFTDVNAQWGALSLLSIIAIITAVLLLANVFLRGVWLPALAIGIWLLAAIFGGTVYPAIVQRFQVVPSQLAKELPYIQNNIAMTRQAFGLDKIQEQPFPAEEALQPADITANLDTVNNVRLWDYLPLRDTYNQIQSIRLYYDFQDVDIDRYMINGSLRQVAISARELSPQKIAQAAQTWVNQRLQYTHGYGVVLSPVAAISAEGLPELLIRDIPPVGTPEVKRPEIYFGEANDQYVIVNTKTPEFDYPKGDDNVYSQYAGQGGVQINSAIRKLAFAWHFADGNILFTNYLKPESRVLYYRSIQDRVQRIAPFLRLDSDPYIVIADGRLFWIQDAYTTSGQYPCSQPYEETSSVTGAPVTSFNYIRNSVKAVIDAYDGSVKLYVSDPSDPLIQTYRRIFPTLFTDMDQMPESIRSHVRYPQYLFEVQAEKYRTYHMQDPQVLYNGEDLWSLPRESVGGKSTVMEPYYANMRLPGETSTEFLLMMPFTPSNKANMIAWLAARSDGTNYGKLVAFKFPKERLVYGPEQLEARIDQDPTISSQLTLWSQRGSSVIRGNLLVIPIEKSILYVEPIYLQAESSKLPELKRVVVASGNRLAMEPTLGESLAKVFDQAFALGPSPTGPASAPTTPTTPTTPPAPTPQLPTTPAVSGDVALLAKSAADHYARAQEYLKKGDWARYGDELNAMEQDLQKLVALTK